MKLRIAGTLIDADARMSNLDAIAIEKETGLTLPELSKGMQTGSMIAYTAMVWLTRRKAGERRLLFSEVEFDVADVQALDDDDVALSPDVDDQGRVVLDDTGAAVMRRPDGQLVSPKAPASGSPG